ncbi:MAG: SRPBCC family protein [Actinomycetales bacterium]
MSDTVPVAVDVRTEIDIDRAVAHVAAFAAEPGNAPRWYRRIARAEPLDGPALGVGTRTRFQATFLGRTLDYVYEITEYTPGEHLTMTTVDGPFPMTTQYVWHELTTTSCRMGLRNHGDPQGFGALTAPVVQLAMRRANQADLRALKRLIESPSA